MLKVNSFVKKNKKNFFEIFFLTKLVKYVIIIISSRLGHGRDAKKIKRLKASLLTIGNNELSCLTTSKPKFDCVLYRYALPHAL